jgi:polysaccharide export outer membrane protein
MQGRGISAIVHDWSGATGKRRVAAPTRALLIVLAATLAAAPGRAAEAQQPTPAQATPAPSQSPAPPAAATPAPPAGTAATPSATSPAVPLPPAPGVTSDYIIGPGDMIQVFVWRNPELSMVVPVRPDGKISSPLVEDLIAVGKTPSQLARDIEGVLAEYIRNPEVYVIVTNAVSTFNQVKVIGQVRSPQALAYKEGMTLLDVVLAVGGLTDFAAGNRSKLLRKDENGKDQEIKVRLDDLVRKGRLSENRNLKPGDVLMVPEARF